ncbi:MAG: CBS domain-containing protein [Solirubrobacterales bacterium]
MSEEAVLSGSVSDVITPGVITCPPEAPLREVAGLMAGERVHSVVVSDLPSGAGAGWGVIADLDLVEAIRMGSAASAAEAAATEPLTVDAGAPLERAVQLMVEHEVSHLFVTGPEGGEPIGVVSTLDIARALAEGAA